MYRGRCRSLSRSFVFFCHALMSARSVLAPMNLVGPYFSSASKRSTMSMLSVIRKGSAPSLPGISRMGAIFLPQSSVGVAKSSFAMKTTSCFTFFRPSAARADGARQTNRRPARVRCRGGGGGGIGEARRRDAAARGRVHLVTYRA